MRNTIEKENMMMTVSCDQTISNILLICEKKRDAFLPENEKPTG
jgi:hypothetical protein